MNNPVEPSALPLRRRLRRLPALAGDLPAFDPTDLPAEPVELFLTWFEQALADGVPEPHVMTFATADGHGAPSSRVVVLADVRDGGWELATDLRSRKARDLEQNPQAAATFYWQPQGRQVRISGPCRWTGPEASAADFLSRSPASRAAALAVRPGEPLADVGVLAAAMVEEQRRVEDASALDRPAVLEQWATYLLVPDEVEFWQGRPDRAHVRVVYERADDGAWTHGLRWP